MTQRPIPDIDPALYLAGSDGQIWHMSGRDPRPLKARLRAGRLVVSMRLDGRWVTRQVARMMLRAFGVRPTLESDVAIHFPHDDPTDCRPDNLRWARAEPSKPRGPSRRLSEADVARAKRWYSQGHDVLKIAAKLGVGRMTIYRCLKDADSPVYRPAGKLTSDDVAAMRRRYSEGEAVSRISQDMGIRLRTARNAIFGRSHARLLDPPPCRARAVRRAKWTPRRAALLRLLAPRGIRTIAGAARHAGMKKSEIAHFFDSQAASLKLARFDEFLDRLKITRAAWDAEYEAALRS